MSKPTVTNNRIGSYLLSGAVSVYHATTDPKESMKGEELLELTGIDKMFKGVLGQGDIYRKFRDWEGKLRDDNVVSKT